MGNYRQSKYCPKTWARPAAVDPSSLSKSTIAKLTSDTAARRRFLDNFGQVQFDLGLYKDQHAFKNLLAKMEVVSSVYSMEELAKHCQTQNLDVICDRRSYWLSVNDRMDLCQRQQHINNLALRQFKRSSLDKSRNCIVNLYLDPSNPEVCESSKVIQYVDAHMTALVYEDTIAYEAVDPLTGLKSGSAGPLTLEDRFECTKTYPHHSFISGIPIWDPDSVKPSNSIVIRAGIDGVVEGLPSLIHHRWEKGVNIRSESMSSTRNNGTSPSQPRFMYQMRLMPQVGLDFVLLQQLSAESDIFLSLPIETQTTIRQLQAKSDEELRRICQENNINIEQRRNLTQRASMILDIARSNTITAPTSNDPHRQRTSQSSLPRRQRTSESSLPRRTSESSLPRDARPQTTSESRETHNRKRKRILIGEANFVKNGLYSNVCVNNLMTRTTLKSLTNLQALADERIAANEFKFVSLFTVADDLEQLTKDFVSLVNDLGEQKPFSIEQFRQDGEMKPFFEQLYIGMFMVHSLQKTQYIFMRNTLYMTAWRETLDLADTGGYILCQKDNDCDTQICIWRMLRILAGCMENRYSAEKIHFTYFPTMGDLDHQFLEYIGVCTDKVEFEAKDSIYREKLQNRKAKERASKRDSKREKEDMNMLAELT
jgi:hypothetical protein